MELNLYRPHDTQQEVIDCKERFIVLLCGRRWGKSLIAQNVSILKVLNNKKVAYITPTYQLASVFYDEIFKVSGNIFRGNRTELTFKFGDGELRFFTGENIDMMRGQKFHYVIVDEAAYTKNLKDAWERVIRPTLTDYSGGALFVSTPRGYDYFYSLSLINSDGWKTFKFTTYHNPFIPHSEIEEAKKMLPMPVFEQEYMANPMQNADNPFGSDNIRNCIADISTNEPKYWGIDLAKSVDYTVKIALDENGSVCHLSRYQKSWTHTREDIRTIGRKAVGFMDSTGVGDPILEDIAADMPMIRGFKFTSHTKQQLIEGLVSAIHQGLIKYPKGIITDELEVFEYKFTSNGVKYSARDGFHDDTVIALALAWKAFVERKNYGKYYFS